MAQDADAETTAMIAMLLQQDQQELATIHNFTDGRDTNMSELSMSDDSEDDYSRNKKRKKKVVVRKKKSTTKAKPKPRAISKMKDNNNNEENPNTESSSTRAAPRRWDATQETLFIEALDLYGRDWKLCAEHIGHDRLGRDVASHAQKHFIKLYKDDQSLPDKVRESGEGYTLSGKPLDPDSAAARAYGLQGSTCQRQYRRKNKTGDHGASTSDRTTGSDDVIGAAAAAAQTSVNSEEETKGIDKIGGQVSVDGVGTKVDVGDVNYPQMSARARNDQLLLEMRANEDPALKKQKVNHVQQSSASSSSEDKSHPTSKTNAAAKRVLVAHQKKMKREAARLETAMRKRNEKEAKSNALYDDDGLTEYSRNRPRRRAATNYLAEPTGGLQFITPTRYSGAPGAGERGSQPFIVHVHASAYLLVDLHSHTTEAEVIGYLGGSWDAELNTLTVRAAYPGRSKIAGATECEMCPVSEIEQRAAVAADGLKVVGWYHSHPTFEAIPSSCDVDNQTNMQNLFKDGKTGNIPFVALIMSPFNPNSPTHKSQPRWFRVEGTKNSRKPKEVETELIADSLEIAVGVKARASKVMFASMTCPKRIEMGEQWRDQVSYREKACQSLAEWLPPLVQKSAIRNKAVRITQGIDSTMVRTALAGALGKSEEEQVKKVELVTQKNKEEEEESSVKVAVEAESEQIRESRQEAETKAFVQELLCVPETDDNVIVLNA